MYFYENVYFIPIVIIVSIVVFVAIVVGIVFLINLSGDSDTISGTTPGSVPNPNVSDAIRPQACNTLQTESSCEPPRCNWTDGKYKSCGGEGSEGWSCSHFKDVDNSSNKCDRADGCHSVYTGNSGRNREFSECVGFQGGTGHTCADFNEDEELCGDRSGCKPEYSNGTCADT